MGFPQSQGLAGSDMPMLARRGFARAREAFGMGMSYNGAVLQQQALQAMGAATGGHLSVGTGRAGGGVGGGVSMGSGGGFGQSNTSSTIPNVDPSFAEINPAQYWGALSQSVSASGEDDAPVVQPTPQPIKPNFTPYNNGDMRTQGDWNAISNDHSLKNNPADGVRPFGSGGNPFGMGMSEVPKYRPAIPSDFIPTNDTEGLYSPAQAKEMQDAMVRQRKVDAQDKAARDFRAYLDRTTQPEGWDYSQPKTAPIDDRFYPQAIGRSAGMALNSMSMFSAFNPTPPIFAPRPGTAWSPFMSRNKFTRGF